MRTRPRAVELARGVYWLRLCGANVYFVRSGESWTLVDAGFPGSGRTIAETAAGLCGAVLTMAWSSRLGGGGFGWLWDLARRKPRLSGPPTIVTCDWRDAARSVVALADLDPWLLATGHGAPLVGRHAAPALRAFASRVVAEPVR